MNILASQLSLAAVELRNDRKDEALRRLRDTEQTCIGNAIVKSNIAVSQCINLEEEIGQDVSSSCFSQPSTFNPAITSLQQSISLSPLSYIPYYNLFTFYCRQGNLTSAYPHLIQAISALKFQTALKKNAQRHSNQVHKQYCSQSVLVYLIKGVIHVRNQKYVMAVGELLWVVESVRENCVKLNALEMVKLLFKALGQKDKQAEIEQQIAQVKQKIDSQHDKEIQQESFTLVSTCVVPESESELKAELSKKLKEFAQLVKEKQRNSLQSSSSSQVLFKQINQTDLMKNPVTMSSLLTALKSSILESTLLSESESQGRSQYKQSIYHSINQSQEFGSSPNSILSPNGKIEDSPEKRLYMTAISPKRIEKEESKNSLDQSSSKKVDTSLNNSGLNSSGLNSSGIKSKKQVSIYPLKTHNQAVEIKLVMANLTNNKEAIGNMDPYCIITYNGVKKQCKVIKGAGLNPNWKESFMFNLTSKPSSIKVEVYDKETFKKDDFVGSGTMMVEENRLMKVPIYEDKKEAGIVFVVIDSKV